MTVAYTRRGLLVIPAMLALGVLFVAPQLLFLAQSLHPIFGAARVGTGWTFANYAKIFTDSYYFDTLLRTVWLSALATLWCLLLGYPLAYFLARTRSRARGLLTLLMLAPLLITVVVRSLGWIILLSDNGPVNFALLTIGITDAPVRFIYNQFGVIVGLVHAFLPMMVVILLGVIRRIDASLEDAAADLGAGRIQTFAHVVIPLSLPGIAAGCILIFGVMGSTYTTTAMLGGGKIVTTPIQIAQEFQMTLNYPVAAALSVVIAATTFGLAFIGLKVSRAEYLDTAL